VVAILLAQFLSSELAISAMVLLPNNLLALSGWYLSARDRAHAPFNFSLMCRSFFFFFARLRDGDDLLVLFEGVEAVLSYHDF